MMYIRMHTNRKEVSTCFITFEEACWAAVVVSKIDGDEIEDDVLMYSVLNIAGFVNMRCETNRIVDFIC